MQKALILLQLIACFSVINWQPQLLLFESTMTSHLLLMASNWVWQGSYSRFIHTATYSDLKSQLFYFFIILWMRIWAENSQAILLLHTEVLAGVSIASAFLLSGQRKKIQKVNSHVWHHCGLPCGLFFFLWLKWASSWSSQCIQTSYVTFHFQKTSL